MDNTNLDGLGPAPAASRTVVVLQPGYLPWLGFFEQLARADVFVYYDDVQFDKHGWRNRNRIKAASGQPHWLTVPIRHHGLDQPSILDVEIAPGAPWARKHVGTLRQFYQGAPYCTRYLPELEELLNRRWRLLVDLDLAVVDLLCSWLGIQRTIRRSSQLGVGGERSERLVHLCLRLGATDYYSGSAAHAYLDSALFAARGVRVHWQEYQHPVYRQLHGAFIPYLSAIDLLFNCGPASREILLRGAGCADCAQPPLTSMDALAHGANPALTME